VCVCVCVHLTRFAYYSASVRQFSFGGRFRVHFFQLGRITFASPVSDTLVLHLTAFVLLTSLMGPFATLLFAMAGYNLLRLDQTIYCYLLVHSNSSLVLDCLRLSGGLGDVVDSGRAGIVLLDAAHGDSHVIPNLA